MYVNYVFWLGVRQFSKPFSIYYSFASNTRLKSDSRAIGTRRTLRDRRPGRKGAIAEIDEILKYNAAILCTQSLSIEPLHKIDKEAEYWNTIWLRDWNGTLSGLQPFDTDATRRHRSARKKDIRRIVRQHLRSRRLARHIIHNSVNTLDFIRNPGRDLSQDSWRVDEPIGSHEVFRLDSSQRDDLIEKNSSSIRHILRAGINLPGHKSSCHPVHQQPE